MRTLDLSSKNIKAVFAVVLFAAGVAVCAWLAAPVFVRWGSLDHEIERKRLLFEQEQEWLSQYQAAGGDSVKQALSAARAQSGEEELAKALSAIESVSQQSSFRLLNLKPRTSKKIGDHRELSFDITAEGTAQAFSLFIYGLETSPQILAVKNFSVSPASGQSGKLKASILVTHLL